MSSYDTVDYRIRYAKSVERKMIVEAIRKLSNFQNIEDYGYVGFGSIFFSDFALIHKNLGITKMISIEKNKFDEERVNFNCPFSCIKIIYKNSASALPFLSYETPLIIWLDYDGILNESVLLDIQAVCSKICEGSLFIISVNADPENPDKKSGSDDDGNEDEIQPYSDITLKEYRLEKLRDNVGSDKVPMGVRGSDLTTSGLPKVLRSIINNQIISSLNTRNITSSDEEKLIYKQLFNFKYKDSSNMLTIGGLIIKKNQQKIFDVSKFDDLDFISFDEKIVKIEIPILTVREIAFLDANIHGVYDFLSKNLVKIDESHPEKEKIEERIIKIKNIIKESNIKKYAKLYRYYPTFTEAIL